MGPERCCLYCAGWNRTMEKERNGGGAVPVPLPASPHPLPFPLIGESGVQYINLSEVCTLVTNKRHMLDAETSSRSNTGSDVWAGQPPGGRRPRVDRLV